MYMRTKFEQYKKLYIRIVNLLMMIYSTLIFWCMWSSKLNFLQKAYFKNKGNWLVLLVYIVVLFLFLYCFRCFKIGYYTVSDLLLSQVFACIGTHIVIGIQITLMVADVEKITAIVFGSMELALLSWIGIACITIIATKLYNNLLPPYRILHIYGDYKNNVRQKVDSRADKYKICEEISVHTSMDIITDKIKEYDAVLLNDIPSQEKNDILKYCVDQSVRVYFTPKISDIIVKGSDDITLFDTPLFLSKNIELSLGNRFLKRTMDILLSLLGILITFPIMLVTAICIKFEDGGPIFFRQKRCTRFGREFWILKFRSMIVDAEKDGKSRPAMDGDERITKIGKIIRKTRIDELPQLFNILIGQMSIVGPRPERIEHVKKYSEDIPEFGYRMKVKGGLTGYAQVYGRYNTTAYDKLKMDLIYIVNYSVLLDWQIIFETIKVLFHKESTEGFSEEQSRNIRER